MLRIVKKFHSLKKHTRNSFRSIWLVIKYIFGWPGIPKLVTFRGYGNQFEATVTGYVTEDNGLLKPDETHTVLDNILSMIKRYTSDEVPGAEVIVKSRQKSYNTITSDNGIYKLNIPLNTTTSSENRTRWEQFDIVLSSSLSDIKNDLKASCEVLFPGRDSDYGIISDVDDTIIVSHSTHILRKLRLMLLQNSRTRTPLPGAAAFYRALHKGVNGDNQNPVFYVSSSEWNLYDLLDDFCTYHDFPKGVFLLKELKSGLLKLRKKEKQEHQHKYKKITTILETYPDLPFVLIGDSGQKDPEIYARIATEYTHRIKAVYIRLIRKKDRDEKRLEKRMGKLDIPVLFITDTQDAAQHAAKLGLIPEKSKELNELQQMETLI
ncbi:App1 family protein [Saccharicrinis sp. FJH54]|uniref:App1 family protein n=1 Tax=Saccharicrinis sp. FJH54 TaxID=3344665 RepID=UPI0035D4A122